MESVIKKIFSEKSDEAVHGEFIKFSKGVFGNKYLLDAKKQKLGWTIKTSAEYVNTLVRNCLEKMSGEIGVTGVIVATFHVGEKAQFPIERVKQFMGIKQAVVNTTTTPRKILSLMDEYPRAFFALSFSTPLVSIKTKAKAPKSSKPASSGEKEVSADFCTLKTSDPSIVKDLFFDCPDFTEISIKHILNIKEITLPKGVSDPVQIREQAKRKGTITRIIKVDGKEIRKEIEFEA
ncbi:MAG: hypothetical protein AABY00_02440, partial [Nanoarchaeota archaeon]